jgi:prevent-host-death family protein
MRMLTATVARAKLSALLDEIAASHESLLITGRHHNAVLISEEDWRAINETLYLMGIPGMQESIIEGMNTPIEDCDDEVE